MKNSKFTQGIKQVRNKKSILVTLRHNQGLTGWHALGKKGPYDHRLMNTCLEGILYLENMLLRINETPIA
jgi:hypothetical protein